MEQKNKKGGFLGILLGPLIGKGLLRAGYGNKEGEGMLLAGYGTKNF